MFTETEVKKYSNPPSVGTPVFRINQQVKTPIGEGIYQGVYRAVAASIEKYLVRLPVDEQTAQHLKDENCLTPKAVKAALFTFSPSELGGTRRENAIIVALVAVISVLIGWALGWPW